MSSIEAEPQALEAGPGDHGAVVAAQRQRRRDELQARLDRKPLKAPGACAWFAATPPATTSAVGWPAISRKARSADAGAVDHHVDDGGLEAGAEIGDVALR